MQLLPSPRKEEGDAHRGNKTQHFLLKQGLCLPLQKRPHQRLIWDLNHTPLEDAMIAAKKLGVDEDMAVLF